MVTEIQIAKGKAIDTLVSGYSPRKLEEGKIIDDCSVDFSELMNELEKNFDKPFSFLTEGTDWFFDYVDTILTAGQINAFLQVSKILQDKENYANTGYFVSKLILNSYNSGTREFYLRSNPEVKGLLSNLRFRDRVSVIIEGDLGAACAQYSRNLDVVVHGNVGRYFGYGTSDSIFFLKGDADFSVGYQSSNCVFKTDRTPTLVKLMSIPKDGKKIFIHHDGYEEVLKNGS